MPGDTPAARLSNPPFGRRFCAAIVSGSAHTSATCVNSPRPIFPVVLPSVFTCLSLVSLARDFHFGLPGPGHYTPTVSLGSRRLVLPRFAVSDHLSRLGELAKRHSDRKPDLADPCLIRPSELNPWERIAVIKVTYRFAAARPSGSSHRQHGALAESSRTGRRGGRW